MVRALGGPAELLDHPERFLPPAPVIAAARPRRSGYVLRMETRALGLTIVALGGGRRRTGDPIDYTVGLSELCPGSAFPPSRGAKYPSLRWSCSRRRHANRKP
jgi:thymidine phosphorylase